MRISDWSSDVCSSDLIQVAQVDAMSGGRVELGLGAGWFTQEHTAYGIPFPDTKERFLRYSEQLELITGLWRKPVGETYDFTGKHYELSQSPALPKPVPSGGHAGGPTVLLGGVGTKQPPAPRSGERGVGHKCGS